MQWFFGFLGYTAFCIAAALQLWDLEPCSFNFHIFKAVHIAKKQGYKNVEGLAASAVAAMSPNNLLREFFGVVKDFLAGKM